MADAATLVIVDRAFDPAKVLFGRRHQRHAFMPGRLVFPGGRLDRADRCPQPGHSLDPVTQSKLLAQTRFADPADAAALASAAIRETFEETGLVVGTEQTGTIDVPAGWERFFATGLVPNLSALQFVARAITPPGYRRRFDARFFCTDMKAVARSLPGAVHADAEFTELLWLTFDEAHAAGLPSITGIVLRDVEVRVARGFDPSLPVPFYGTDEGDYLRGYL